MYDESLSNFTPRGQQAVALARKEADRFNHCAVGTEHLLLGLIRLGQGVAVNVLKQLGLDLENVRHEVEKQVGTGPDQKVMIGNVPFTPRFKKVLSLANKEAKALHHSYVGTEHLLLGLLVEGEGLSARVLRDLGLTDIDGLRRTILRELDPNYNTEGASEGVPGVAPNSKDSGYDGAKIGKLSHQFLSDIVDGITLPTRREGSLLSSKNEKELWFIFLDVLLVFDYTFNNVSLNTILALNSVAVTMERLNIVCRIVKRCGSDQRLRELVEQIQNLYNVAVSGSEDEIRYGCLLQRLTGDPPRKVGPPTDWLKKESFFTDQPYANGGASSAVPPESAKPSIFDSPF